MPESIRVLHVEDEPEFGELASEFLERADGRLEVDSVTGASEGLALLGEREYDCVVSDYEMPGRNGIEFLEAVREEYPDLPFILFTGKGSEAVASEAISAGVTDYLQKEGGTDQYEILANRIGNAVDSARAKAAARRNRDRLESLLAAFPDVTFVIDDSGEYLDVLPGSADTLLYDDPEELVGQRFHDLLPPATADRFLNAVHDTLASGDPHRIEYELDVQRGTRWFDARIVPLEEGVADRPAVLWVARDVTERKERERALAELNDVATEITTYDDPVAVCERTIEAAETSLDFDLSVVSLEEDGVLPAVALSEDLPEEGTATMSVEEGITGLTYRTGESYLITDVSEFEAANPQGPYESGVSVPVGDHGVFQAVSERPGEFDETDRELAELLATHAARALDRLAE